MPASTRRLRRAVRMLSEMPARLNSSNRRAPRSASRMISRVHHSPTTLGVLTTLVRPSGGRALVAGLDVMREPLAVRRAMGVVFQDPVLDNDFSGFQNMRLHARLWRVPEDRIAVLLDAVGLTGRASDGVRTYSGGMKRRLEIARALLGRPRILLLDEPTLGLDPIVRSELWEMIRALQAEQGVTVLVSTHYLEEAQSVCDRVAIIDQG